MNINRKRIGTIWIVTTLIISALVNVGFVVSNTKASTPKYIDVTCEIIDKSFDGTPPTDSEESRTISKAPTQTEKIIVILIEFNDTKHDPTHDQTYYNNFVFNQTVGANSMYNYYYENSYGQAGIIGEVTAVWYTAQYDEGYYGDESGVYPANPQGLVVEAVNAANVSIDFSLYDTDSDGYVDHVMIVHAGNDEAVSGNSTNIWSHRGYLEAYKVTVDNKIVDNYMMLAETDPLGVFCHEFGHDLGLPDLYDTDYSSHGIGEWDLMSSGNWLGGGIDNDNDGRIDEDCPGDMNGDNWPGVQGIDDDGDIDIDFNDVEVREMLEEALGVDNDSTVNNIENLLTYGWNIRSDGLNNDFDFYVDLDASGNYTPGDEKYSDEDYSGNLTTGDKGLWDGGDGVWDAIGGDTLIPLIDENDVDDPDQPAGEYYWIGYDHNEDGIVNYTSEYNTTFDTTRNYNDPEIANVIPYLWPDLNGIPYQAYDDDEDGEIDEDIDRDGTSPSHLCAWSKIQLGWIKPVNLTIEGYYEINPVENYNDTVYKFSITNKEYFLIEFRKKTGYDSYLPGEGLLIWHIDDNQPNNNNESHKKVDLEEADESYQTNNGLDGNDTTGDRGSANDTWKDNLTGFTSTAIPNSNSYDGNTTDMSINHISQIGNKMSFIFGSTLIDIGIVRFLVPSPVLVGNTYSIYSVVGSNSIVDIYNVAVKFTVSYDGGDPQPLPDGNIQLLPAGACKVAETSWYVASAGSATLYTWIDYDPVVEITAQEETNIGYANVSWETADITKYVFSSDVGDIDNDGVMEIVVSNATGIYVFNGENYSLEWTTEGIEAFSDLIWDPAVGNLDADPALEIVASNRSHVFVIDGITHNIEWDSGDLGSNCRDIVIDDIDGDGENEIITGTAYWEDMVECQSYIYHYGNIYVFNTSTITPEWKSNDFTYSILSLCVSDFDSDGKKEIVVGADNGYVHTFDGETHASEYSSNFIGYFIDSVVVDDVDDDGNKEMVVGNGYVDYGTNISYGCVYVYTAGGSLEWNSDVLFSLTLVVADPDGDGTKEIVTGTYSGLYAFDAKTHNKEWYYPKRILSLAVGDIDGDTANEIVASDDLYIFGVKQTYTFNLREGWSLITMPHIPYTPTPYKVWDWINALGSNCTKIAQWNNTQQKWLMYERGVESNNFTIDSGIGYFAYCIGNASWTVAGKLITSTIVNLSAGWNSIGWHNSAPADAENLGMGIVNCTAVAYWDNILGRFVTHPMGTDISNFTVKIGEGYFVHVTTESKWVN